MSSVPNPTISGVAPPRPQIKPIMSIGGSSTSRPQIQPLSISRPTPSAGGTPAPPAPSVPSTISRPASSTPSKIQPIIKPPSPSSVVSEASSSGPSSGTGSALRRPGAPLLRPSSRKPARVEPKITAIQGTVTPMSLLQFTQPQWNGTESQILQLIDLTYANGNPIFDAKHRDIWMEIVGMLIRDGFEYTYEFLTSPENTGPDYILWEQKEMDEGRNAIARELIISRTEKEGIKGVGKCRNCNSTELAFAEVQTRAGDEASTLFVACVMCGNRWRQ